LSRRVNAYYNSNFYRADNRSPSYRKAIVSSRTCDISRLRETLCPEPDATEAEKLYSLQLLDMLMHTLSEEWSSLALSLHERLASKEREFAEQEAAHEQVIAALKENLADKEQYIQALISKPRAESEEKAAVSDL